MPEVGPFNGGDGTTDFSELQNVAQAEGEIRHDTGCPRVHTLGPERVPQLGHFAA